MEHENAFSTGPVRCVSASTYLRLRFLDAHTVSEEVRAICLKIAALACMPAYQVRLRCLDATPSAEALDLGAALSPLLLRLGLQAVAIALLERCCPAPLYPLLALTAGALLVRHPPPLGAAGAAPVTSRAAPAAAPVSPAALPHCFGLLPCRTAVV